jgi:hypothetical protein
MVQEVIQNSHNIKGLLVADALQQWLCIVNNVEHALKKK